MAQTLRSLYICYLSVEDPLVETQVVAYLEGLAERGHTIHLLTFDRRLDAGRKRRLKEELCERGIAWHSLRYHKRPSLPATIYDAVVGALAAIWLCRRHGLDALHARNHVPAASALIARRLVGAKLVFDLRGLMAEEYVDAGRWREGGIAYRITKRIERGAIQRADAMVMLTERVRRHLFGSDPPQWTSVIPCCVKLDRQVAGDDVRDRLSRELGTDQRPILAYVGKYTGWYLEDEMTDFFLAAQEQLPDLFFLVITQLDPRPMADTLEQRGVGSTDYKITSLPAAEVADFLAASDFGISFIRPTFSKISSSPTKIGEYLGAGLPVVSGTGIGDLDDLLGGREVGVLVDEFSAAGYRDATSALVGLLDDPGTPERCRSLAREQLSLEEVGIPRYDNLYRQVAARVGSR